jgi:sensor domain CHASE-containing protein
MQVQMAIEQPCTPVNLAAINLSRISTRLLLLIACCSHVSLAAGHTMLHSARLAQKHQQQQQQQLHATHPGQ